MNIAAMIEELGMSKRPRMVSVDEGLRVCVNCAYYEQYFRRNRGNVATYVGVGAGYCLLKDKEKRPLDQPCKCFEKYRR